MGLQVWLPLNGTIENKGIYKTNILTNQSTCTTGKYGSCASFNGSSQYIQGTFYATDTMTFALWVNFPTLKSSHLIDARVNNAGYQPMYFTPTQIQIGGSGTSSYPYIQVSPAFTTNTWYHIAVTYGPTTGTLYVNGVKQGSNTGSRGYAFNAVYNYTLASRFNNSNYNNCMIQDFRIYDECLSDEDIARLARGLVIHYPMTDSISTNGWLEPNSLATITRASGNTFYDFTYKSNLLSCSDTSYIVDCWLKASASDVYCDFYFRDSGGSAYALTAKTLVTTSWKHYSFPLTGSPENLVLFRARCYGGTAGSKLYISNVKLFSANTPNTDTILYDISGYGNNGEWINTTMLSSTDSQRYNTSMIFNGTTTGILISNKLVSQILNSTFTCSYWMKSVSENGGRSIYFGGYNNTPCVNLEKNASNQFRFWWNGSPDQLSAKNLVMDGSWMHICLVRESTTVTKLYINGSLAHTFTGTTNALSSPKDLYRIGRDTRTDATGYHGYMQDFRLYHTALNENAVQELYRMGATV